MSLPSEFAERLRQPGLRVALVGASAQPAKFGFIIAQDLIAKGFDVIPVHPSETTLFGRTVYPEVGAIPGSVDLVNFVVPPEVGRRMLDSLDAALWLWFQPGSYDGALLAAARPKFAHLVAGPCIMVETR